VFLRQATTDLGGPETPPPPDPPLASSVIVGSDPELRTLLRGLLRLRRFQIAGESDAGREAEEVVGRVRPALVVIDGGRTGERVGPLIQWTRAHVPTARIVLIGTEPPTSAPPDERPDVAIARPFRIRDFEAAVDPARTG
jgi:AmiR/NasT family two-component response regulator